MSEGGHSAMAGRTVTFIGIGAQKTASTWLHNALAQIPGVAVSDPKEVDFFTAHFDRGYEWYERHFAAAAEAVERGEVSPSYFVAADAPARAAAYNGDLRILVTLRDPVERAFSNHLHEVQRGHVSGANLEFDAALSNNPLYLEQGRYAHHLAPWFEQFGRERILVLFQEEIRTAGAAMAGRVADFLGRPATAPVIDRRANESVAYRNRLVGETFWRLGKAARARGLGAVVEAVKKAPGVRQMRSANRREVRDDVAPMRAQTADRLTRFYAPDVAALGDLLGGAPPWPRFAAADQRAVRGGGA